MSNELLPPENLGIRERLIALIQAILLENNQLEEMVKKSKFQKHFLPVILGLVRQLPALIGPMLEGVSDEDLRRGLVQFRDEFIPFILGDDPGKWTEPTIHEDAAPAMLEAIHPEEVPSLARLGGEKKYTIEKARVIHTVDELEQLIEDDKNENPPWDR